MLLEELSPGNGDDRRMVEDDLAVKKEALLLDDVEPFTSQFERKL